MLRISFLPVAILSSSPKLNFFIIIPAPIATAAAGVAIFIIQLLTVVKLFSNFVTSFGVAAKQTEDSVISNISVIIIIYFMVNPFFLK